MADFKLDIGDQKTKRTFKFELKSPDADQLFGKKIGETFRGELINLTGFEFKITGGSDRSGFPMRKDVDGVGRRKLLLGESVGYHVPKKHKGRLAKRSIRGNTVSAETAQVNAIIVKYGSEDLNAKFPPKVNTAEQSPAGASPQSGSGEVKAEAVAAPVA